MNKEVKRKRRGIHARRNMFFLQFQLILPPQQLCSNCSRLKQPLFRPPLIISQHSCKTILLLFPDFCLNSVFEVCAPAARRPNGSASLLSCLEEECSVEQCVLLNNQCLIGTNASLYDPSGCEWNKLALHSCRGQWIKKEGRRKKKLMSCSLLETSVFVWWGWNDFLDPHQQVCF